MKRFFIWIKGLFFREHTNIGAGIGGRSKKSLTDADRERIIEAVNQSKSGEGWIYIRETILEWKATEERQLQRFQITGIREQDVSDYNRCVDRIAYIERFSRVHEIIVDFNSSILQRMRDYVDDKIQKAESFVREVIRLLI